MKKTLLSIAVAITAMQGIQAQQFEVDADEWKVTKITNLQSPDGNQIVNNANEITEGPDGWLWITERQVLTTAQGGTDNGASVVRINPDTGEKEIMLDLRSKVFSNAGQDGLMGMAIHPSLYTNNPTDPYVYLAYTYEANAATDIYTVSGLRELRIERYTYRPGSDDLDPDSGFTLIDKLAGSNDHSSARMKIGPDGMLYFTSGDLGYNQFKNKCVVIQSQSLPTQQEVNNKEWRDYKGKILRMTLTGGIPADNPTFLPHDVLSDDGVTVDNTNYTFSDQSASGTRVRSHIYSYGHRNAQGIIFAADGTLYSSEHGDRVDDEVNIITAGGNYGWPFIVGDRDGIGFTHCKKQSLCATNSTYAGNGNNDCSFDGDSADVYPELDQARPSDLVDPIANYNSNNGENPPGGFRTWPTIAPSSIDIYEGNGDIPWNKSILIPSLKSGTIYRYELNAAGDGIVGGGTTNGLISFHATVDRYRDIAMSADGKTIYAITDSKGQTSGPSGTDGLPIENPGAIFKFEYIKKPSIYISEVTNPSDDREGVFVEIYNYGDQDVDLAETGVVLGRQRSGDNTNQEELALTGTVAPGQYFVVGRDGFNAIYGQAPDLVASDDLLGGDGDDPYALVYQNSFNSLAYVALDSYGNLDQDGAGQDWDFSNNRRISRKRSQNSRAAVFDLAQWNRSDTGSLTTDATPFEPDPLTFIYASNAITPQSPVNLTTRFDNLIVQDGSYRLPQNLTFKNVTVDNGATLDLDDSIIDVAGNLTINGAINDSNGTMRLTVDGAHSINGSAASIHNLETNAAVTINADVSVTNILTAASGQIDITSGNKIILKSTAAGTAYVDQVPSGVTINGDVQVERFIPGKRAFRFISSPVTTTSSIYENWQESGSVVSGQGTHITGDASGANGFDATATGNPSLYSFDNTASNWTAVTSTNSATDVLVAGKPYRLFVRGDRTVDLSNNEATATATTLRMTGELVTQQVNQTNLSQNAGDFNMIGNPYQAPVDLSQVIAASTNVSQTDIYMWDPTINERGAYVNLLLDTNTNTVDGSAINKFLQPNTAFFITTSNDGSASIAFAEANKNTAQETLDVYSIPSMVRVSLYPENEIDGETALDGTIAIFKEDYSALATNEDAAKFMNLDESIYTIVNDTKLSVNRLPSIENNDKIEIGLNHLRSDRYRLSIDATRYDKDLFLYDAVTDNYTPLSKSEKSWYAFDKNEDDNDAVNRFTIVSTQSTLSNSDFESLDLTVYPNPTSGKLFISATSLSGLTTISLTNLLGQEVYSHEITAVANQSIEVHLPANINTGNFILKVVNDGQIMTEKIIIQ
ncbi:PQQ-dependent sugar dehydrogenase [Nonlabens ponticola]|uniref:T9SS type A sorting domain-containing protein n=1 Tax=Nonlabens ponticola TaxID=2496866 RepID=A0A3S9MYQ2_9FLAO|nr:PQQ-dependent sugar dehydrogenase [Nonlabens ponticola]AZQ44254.1 T9SS type A sorting domain-containing protein [Nonlabens ponticola]